MPYKIVYIHSWRAVKFPYKYSESHNAIEGRGLKDGEFVIPADARMDGIEDVSNY